VFFTRFDISGNFLEQIMGSEFTDINEFRHYIGAQSSLVELIHRLRDSGCIEKIENYYAKQHTVLEEILKKVHGDMEFMLQNDNMPPAKGKKLEQTLSAIKDLVKTAYKIHTDSSRLLYFVNEPDHAVENEYTKVLEIMNMLLDALEYMSFLLKKIRRYLS